MGPTCLLSKKGLDNPPSLEYSPLALEDCTVKLEKRFNKDRPGDRTQADPRVVIGGMALSTGYSPAEGHGAFTASLHDIGGTAETWRGIRGGVPL